MSFYPQPYPPPQNFSLFSYEEFAFSKNHDYNVTKCFYFDETRDTKMGIYVGAKNVYSSYIGCPETNVWNAFYGSYNHGRELVSFNLKKSFYSRNSRPRDCDISLWDPIRGLNQSPFLKEKNRLYSVIDRGEDEVSQYREELCLAAIKTVEEQMGPFIGLCDKYYRLLKYIRYWE
ncbi:hypothetical protein FOZ63_029417 [Perkinsus olseni]|uniref:Uncharacterized protein n=1 Tax=Perkinsus olseni TaxID=32597 RepID=A0A7J6S4F1_PEROL|nr:hypothetical protein FOZ63_029417 [Perkinsus olseni]